MNTDKLIDALAEDASPQRSFSRVLLLAAISGAGIAGAFVVTVILAVAATGAAPMIYTAHAKFFEFSRRRSRPPLESLRVLKV